MLCAATDGVPQFDDGSSLLDDLMKWKETDSAVLRPSSAIVDCKVMLLAVYGCCN